MYCTVQYTTTSTEDRKEIFIANETLHRSRVVECKDLSGDDIWELKCSSLFLFSSLFSRGEGGGDVS